MPKKTLVKNASRIMLEHLDVCDAMFSVASAERRTWQSRRFCHSTR